MNVIGHITSGIKQQRVHFTVSAKDGVGVFDPCQEQVHTAEAAAKGQGIVGLFVLAPTHVADPTQVPALDALTPKAESLVVIQGIIQVHSVDLGGFAISNPAFSFVVSKPKEAYIFELNQASEAAERCRLVAQDRTQGAETRCRIGVHKLISPTQIEPGLAIRDRRMQGAFSRSCESFVVLGQRRNRKRDQRECSDDHGEVLVSG